MLPRDRPYSLSTPLIFALLLLCAAGVAAGRRVVSPEGWMGGGQGTPSWILAVSWISAEFSAMTMIGVPAAAYHGDWSLMQFFLGSAFARIVVAFVFVGRLYGEGPDIYAYLERRFGTRTRIAGSALFVVSRTLFASVRLMAIAAVAASFFSTPEQRWVFLFAAAAALSVSWGGLRAAVWTGLLQAGAIVFAGGAVLSFLVAGFEGGLGEGLRVAENAGRFAVWSWSAPAAVITGFVGSLAAFGTDQETLQRLFCARSRISAQQAVIFAAAGAGLVLVLFLALGTGLFVFYEQRTALALPASPDTALAHFAAQALSAEKRGLLLAGFVLASIDLPLVGLATVFPGPGSGRAGLKRLRIGAAVWAFALAGGAVAFLESSRWLWIGFKIGGIVYGPLLGVFLYGFFGPRRSDGAGAASLAASAFVCACVLGAIESSAFSAGWHWLPLFGAVLAAGLVHVLSRPGGSRGGRSQERKRSPKS